MLVTMGVDIGQKRDPTAICVAEEDTRKVEQRTADHFLIRHLERLPLGTLYPRVAERISQVASGVLRHSGCYPTLYVDATGVGAPIVDLLWEESSDLAEIVAVYFTHGDKRTEELREGELQVKLGKAYLVSRLQALLQTGRLHLPRTREAEALAQELLDYEIRVDENANDRYGAFRVGTHDDLVTALGLATQKAPPALMIY